jgi:hypothetical protein
MNSKSGGAADTAAAIWRTWLRNLPNQTGKSLTAIASDVGVAASTLTRPLKPDDPGTSTPNQRTIDLIVQRYGVPAPAFAPAQSIATAHARNIATDAEPFEPKQAGVIAEAVKLLAQGRADTSIYVMRTRSLELAGFLPGDIVLVDHQVPAKPGDPVCGLVTMAGREPGCCVMRVFERAGSALLLVGASIDPAFRQPIAVDDRVELKGAIVGMIRPARAV